MKRLMAGISLALLLSGCYTVELAKAPVLGPDVEGHVYIRNSGWNILGCIPLVCGNATDPLVEVPHGPWAFFRDDVTMDKVQSRLVNYAATKSEKKLIDITYNAYDTLFFSIPGLQIPVPIPYLLCYREIQISGTLK